MGKMITVEYAEEARFFPQRVILRITPKSLIVLPSATGLAWIDGENKPILDKKDSLDPGDNVADPLLDARVLSVHRNSTVDRHGEFRNAVSELVQSPWAGWVVSGPRTFLRCCKFFSGHALYSSVHHSRFVQLRGLLPTDPAPQEQGLLCRAIELGLTVDQLQGMELSCFELWVKNSGGQPHLSLDREFASGVLANNTAAAKERRKLREERAGAPPTGGQKK